MVIQAKQPWFKFYTADWRGDPKLRKCSLAARGLWIELCAVMHECEPYGYLCDEEGRAPPIEEVAIMVGAPVPDVILALTELHKRRVFSRTATGVIFSRRMVRAHHRSVAASAKGKKGGNPDLKSKPKTTPDDGKILHPSLSQKCTSGLSTQDKPQLKLVSENPSQLNHPAYPYMLEAREDKKASQLASSLVDLTASEGSEESGSAKKQDQERTFAPDDPWGDLARDLIFLIETKSKGAVIGANCNVLHEWRDANINIDLARSVVSEGIKRDGPKGSVSFWDARVRERDAQRKAAMARPVVRRRQPEDLTEDQWTSAIKLFHETGAWVGPGHDPEMSTCRAPHDILASYGYGPLARRRQ